MQKSLMPKGVDHLCAKAQSIPLLNVQKSLMPKGVDHRTSFPNRSSSRRVQKSLMPKGVDHVAVGYRERLDNGAKIFDAERH